MNEIATSADLKKLFYRKRARIAEQAIHVVNEMRDYWPLTVRQAYYQLVAREVIPNKKKEYDRMSEILVRLREHELVPWAAIEDRSRRTIPKRGYSDVTQWLQERLGCIDPRYYGRCRVRTQGVYVEISSEKDALTKIISEAVWPYCTRINVVRGQASATIVHDMATRFDAAIMRGQQPILVHLGDLDPSGVTIPKSIADKMERRHSVLLDVRHIALTPEQVEQYDLPNSVDAVKSKDPNYGAWIKAYGPHQSAVELDALHPQVLTDIITRELSAIYDMSSFADEIQTESKDRKLIGNIQQTIMDTLAVKYPELGLG